MDFKISMFQYLESLPQENINLANSQMGGISPEGYDSSDLESIIASIYQVQRNQVLLVPSGTFGSFFILYYLRSLSHRLFSIVPEYPVFFYQAEELNYEINLENRLIDGSLDLSPWDVEENSVYFISNPNNPTGFSWSEESVRSIIRETEGNNSYLVIDDTFSFFNQKYQRPKVDIGNLIILGSISKFFGNSGAKLGWIISKEEIIERMRDKLRYMVPIIPEINRRRVAYLFNNINIYNSFNFKKLEENYKVLKENLKDFLLPSGIQIIDTLQLDNKESLSVSQRIISKGVNVVPGYFFGADNIIRIAIGIESKERIEKAAKIILESIK